MVIVIKKGHINIILCWSRVLQHKKKFLKAMSTIVRGRRLGCCLFNRKILRDVRYLRRLSTNSQATKIIMPRKPRDGDNLSVADSGGGLSSFQWMSQYGPAFEIRGEQVQIMTEPDQFYEVLKLKTRKARKRIAFASLYLGTGNLEKSLVSCIQEACEVATLSGNTDFEVNILLDYTRGSRGEVNSRTILYPLMSDHPCVNLSLYHTPDLRGVLKKIVPDRFNETIGLTHIKVYLFDDSFIISGANLSHDYFTNRQDRYILFNDCPELADFFNNFIKSIMSFSISVQPDSESLHKDWNIHPYQGDYKMFKEEAQHKIKALLQPTPHIQNIDTTKASNGPQTESDTISSKPPDTIVYPLVQMGPLGISNDEQAMLDLLKWSQAEDNILLASGYFNLTEEFMQVIVEQSKAKFSILMASPQANGFLGARGLAGAIPYSYLYLAHLFLDKVASTQQLPRISMMEYSRQHWTFHGKGLWYYLHGQELPTMTLVGSPNYGYRSVYKDLECEVAIVTENKELQQQLRDEHVEMYSSSSQVTEATFEKQDRYVPHWIRAATSIIKHYF